MSFTQHLKVSSHYLTWCTVRLFQITWAVQVYQELCIKHLLVAGKQPLHADLLDKRHVSSSISTQSEDTNRFVSGDFTSTRTNDAFQRK